MKNSICLILFLVTSFISTVQNYYFGQSLPEKDLSNNSVLASLQNSKGFILQVFFEGLSAKSFESKLSNISKLKNTRAVSLQIGTLPYFWKSNCACFFYIILLVLFVAFAIRYYQRYLEGINSKKRAAINNLKEKEISDAKIEFFTIGRYRT